jgi:hypothetical protein
VEATRFLLVTTGPDPVVHAGVRIKKSLGKKSESFPSAWIAGSFDVKTALRAFCSAMTK